MWFVTLLCVFLYQFAFVCHCIVLPLQGVAKDEISKEGVPYTAVAAQLESMQKHLSTLKLEDTLGSELVGTLTDPQGAFLK